jgi:origin recognition complex subunit 4
VQVIPEGDWLCRDCRPDEDEELMLVDTGTVSEPSLDLEASNIPDIEGFEYHMQVMQKLVLDKLTGQRRLKLYGLDEEYRKVHQVVEQTVLAGEGNSMLVIGARGCGKTAVSQPNRILETWLRFYSLSNP